jgi:hypothetical protein
MDRKMVGMSNFPSVYLSIMYLSIHPSIYPSFLSTLSISVYAAVHLSSCLCLCVHLSILLSTSLFRDLSISLSLYLSVLLWSMHLSSCLSTSSSFPFYQLKYQSISPIHLSRSSFLHLDSSTASKQVTFAQTRYRANRPLVSVVVQHPHLDHTHVD